MIKSIHQKVLEAINTEGCNLNMDDWHTCDTEHCRAGWIEFLAGKEGIALGERTTHTFAAMAIVDASSPIKLSPVDFYKNNEEAMKDIIRCAEAEKEFETKNLI